MRYSSNSSFIGPDFAKGLLRQVGVFLCAEVAYTDSAPDYNTYTEDFCNTAYQLASQEYQVAYDGFSFYGAVYE